MNVVFFECNSFSSRDTIPSLALEIILALDQLLKSPFEILIKDGVNQRVDERVQIAQPNQKVGHLRRETAGFTDGNNHLMDEEGQPADDKSPQNESQSGGGLPFTRAGDVTSPDRPLSARLRLWAFHSDTRPVAFGGGFRHRFLRRAQSVQGRRLSVTALGKHVSVHLWLVEAAGSPVVKSLRCSVDLVVENENEY